jgi:hypothetical protein
MFPSNPALSSIQHRLRRFDAIYADRAMVRLAGGKRNSPQMQSLANGKIYVQNIRDGLISVDPGRSDLPGER